MDAYMLTILVTGVQEKAIKDLFHCKGWKFEKNDAVPVHSDNCLPQSGLSTQPAVTLSNAHHKAPLQYLELHPQCVSSENVAEPSAHNPYDRQVTVPDSIVDRRGDVHGVEKLEVLHKNQVENLPLTVSELNEIQTQTIDLGQTYCDTVIDKHAYNLNYPHLDVNRKNGVCSTIGQKVFPGSSPQKVEYTSAVDMAYSACLSNDVTEILHRRYDGLTSGYGQVQTGLLDVARNQAYTKKEEYPEIGDVSSLDTGLQSESDRNTDKDNAAGCSFKLKKCIHSNRDVSTETCIKKDNGKELLRDFEIIYNFIENISGIDFDQNLVKTKMKEIVRRLKLLLSEKLVSDSLIIEDSSVGEERELRKSEVDEETLSETCSSKNKTVETGLCDSDLNIELTGDNSSDSNLGEANSYTDIEAIVVSSAKIDILSMSTNVHVKKKLKHQVKKKTLTCVSKHERTKSTRHKTFSCSDQDSSVNTRNRKFLAYGSDTKADYPVKEEKVKVKNSSEQHTKKTSCLNEEKGISLDKKRNNETAKFRWTVNRNLRMHKFHRKCKSVPPDLDTENYSNVEKGFYCPDCRFIFKGKNKLILHKRLKNGYCLPDCIYCDADEQKDVFQCSKCPKCFQTKEMLERHEEKHPNSLRCNFCESVFYTSKDLKIHVQIQHPECSIKMYLCDLCGSKFKERKVLNAHRRFVHSDERPEVCMSCNKRFKTKSQLKNHLVTHKKATELNLSCEVCGKMFLRVATLKDHVRRHKKEYTCFCTICNKGFYRKYCLEEHMRMHTGDKPFDCKVCGFKCALSCNLAKHMKVHQKYHTNT